MEKSILGLILILAVGLFALGCSVMGKNPSKEKVAQYKNSSNFDIKDKVFVNRKPKIIDEMWSRNLSLKSMLDFFKTAGDLEPKEKLPEVHPTLSEFLESSEDLKVIWLGHSTLLLNIEGKRVLIDPVFSKAASPVSFLVKRFQAPALSLEELPEIDYILISHDHYDHLDMDSIKFFKNSQTRFLVPLGVSSHLESWGIQSERIIEKDWWEKAEFDGLRFIATPAQHFSGRGVFDRNKTLWASWVIQTDKHNLYYSGDSGYDVHFKKIGDLYGPFDLAFIESGQYNEKWEEVHMLPHQSLAAFKDLRAKRYFPIHWGMFVLAKHTWSEPVKKLAELSKGEVDFVIPKLGEIVNLSRDFRNESWWVR